MVASFVWGFVGGYCGDCGYEMVVCGAVRFGCRVFAVILLFWEFLE